MNRNWLLPINDILDADTNNLRALALSVGANPKSFYVNQDLSKCDLSGQDLRGMDLTGTNISADKVNAETQIDAKFDPVFRFNDDYVRIRIGNSLLALVYSYALVRRYKYKAWAIKNLIDRALVQDRWTKGRFVNFINENKNFKDLLAIDYGDSQVLNILIYNQQQKAIFDICRDRLGLFTKEIYLSLILEGILNDRLRGFERKDYAVLTPMSLYDDVRIHLEGLRR